MSCNRIFELIRKFDEADKHVTCREVGCDWLGEGGDSSKIRILSSSGFILKGSGWARDGYTKKTSPKDTK